MASALLHLFGGILWVMIGIVGPGNGIDPLQLLIYITIFCGILQAYHVFNLNSKN
jgi:hypothetical protein